MACRIFGDIIWTNADLFPIGAAGKMFINIDKNSSIFICSLYYSHIYLSHTVLNQDTRNKIETTSRAEYVSCITGHAL